MHERKTPSKNSVKYQASDNRAVILFVTICTNGRAPFLANQEAFDCIVAAFRQASYWLVGKFVVMPDHIHFFCAPGTWPPYDFHKWMAFLKSAISRSFPWRRQVDEWNQSKRCGASTRHLFQVQCWDTQLRLGDSYGQKWEYVRNNPVRKGLAAVPDDWPYQGELNVLTWHD
ncbi:MAG: transposase [Planctomycetes bacterium]|nr:transposase [Planctomycetota bacterium]